MRIFLSYSRADLEIAEEIAANLKQAGHKVFFDRESIRPSEDFNRIIWKEIKMTDLFVYLISPNSTSVGSFALTELMLAEKKWPNPERHVLPVVIETTELSSIPVYASISQMLHPEGNLAAEVRVEVNTLNKRHRLKRYLQATALFGGLMIIGWFAYLGYQTYLEQRPYAAREKLVAMDVFKEEDFVETASRGDVELVNLYLIAGMDPNVTPKRETTALMKAAGNGHLEIVERLIDAGADVNIESSDAAPALAWAAVHGDDAIVRALLAAGANNESVNDAFIRAASGKKKDRSILNLLLEHGVAQSEIDKAFVKVAEKGDIGLLEFLMDKVSDRKQVLSEGLVAAAANFTIDKIKSFQEKGIDVFNYLLDQGADVNYKRQDREFTALIFVAANGSPRLAQLLLERGADPDIRCNCRSYLNGGWTALTLAIENKGRKTDRDAIISLLLENGADVNLPRKYRDYFHTPLMLASSSNDPQLVLNLLGRGAKANVQNTSGYTALAYAAGNKEILTFLLEHGGDIHLGANPLLRYMRGYEHQAVKNLLEAGVDVNKPNQDGQTPLMLATQGDDADLVRMLLKAGARTTDQDKMGRTALVFAKRKKHTEIIELLQNTSK